MNTTSESLASIRKLRADKKFVAKSMYPGAPDEKIRLRCEASVNRLLDDVLVLLARDASKDVIFGRAKEMLDEFSEEDTEEHEQADTYVGELMRAIGIDDWTDFI